MALDRVKLSRVRQSKIVLGCNELMTTYIIVDVLIRKHWAVPHVWKCGDLMVTVLNSGSSSLGSSLDWDHCVVF